MLAWKMIRVKDLPFEITSLCLLLGDFVPALRLKISVVHSDSYTDSSKCSKDVDAAELCKPIDIFSEALSD